MVVFVAAGAGQQGTAVGEGGTLGAASRLRVVRGWVDRLDLSRLLCLLAARPSWFRRCAVTVILVRHAEPLAGAGDDPGLAPEGHARAQDLVHVLESVPIRAVFHSEFQRTRETAQAVADAVSVTPEQFAFADVTGLVTRISQLEGGTACLVVGHSNTVPDVIEALGGGTFPDFEPAEFDNLFVIIRRACAPTLRLRYGQPT